MNHVNSYGCYISMRYKYLWFDFEKIFSSRIISLLVIDVCNYYLEITPPLMLIESVFRVVLLDLMINSCTEYLRINFF
jgi:hypothetical protein